MTTARNETTAGRRGLLPRRSELLGELPLAAVLVACTLLEVAVNHNTERQGIAPAPWSYLVAVLLAVSVVALRRRQPIVALVVASGVGQLFGAGAVLSIVAAYQVGYRVRELWKVAIAAVFVGVVPTVLSWYFVIRFHGPENELGLILVITVIFSIVPTMIGRYARQRVALTEAGWERARRLEREHAMVVEQAKLRERSRIAQDMHDSLGHELSLIALQAGALELDTNLPERQRETAKLLRTTTADAVSRLREIVGVLRDDTDPAPTEPAAEGVSALVERAANAGLIVSYDEAGATTDGLLPPMTDRALYRVVQETLTNATKHAPGSAVTVRLRYNDNDVVVEVTNQTTKPVDADQNGGGGRGLIGLAERVRLAGGRFTAGPRAEGGFSVQARLPRRLGSTLANEPAGRIGLPRLEPPQTEVARFADYPTGVARLRRSFWFKLVVPIVGLVAFAAFYLVYASLQMSTLHPERFEGLTDGQPQQTVQNSLPPGTPTAPADFGPVGAEPKDQECRYYIPRNGQWWDFTNYDGEQLFRVCYADGKLDSHVALQQQKATQ